jgi:hypothetical protein
MWEAVMPYQCDKRRVVIDQIGREVGVVALAVSLYHRYGTRTGHISI